MEVLRGKYRAAVDAAAIRIVSKALKEAKELTDADNGPRKTALLKSLLELMISRSTAQKLEESLRTRKELGKAELTISKGVILAIRARMLVY